MCVGNVLQSINQTQVGPPAPQTLMGPPAPRGGSPLLGLGGQFDRSAGALPGLGGKGPLFGAQIGPRAAKKDPRHAATIGLAAAGADALAEIQSGREAADIANFNAKLANRQAKVVESRAAAGVRSINRRARRIAGQQRASAAAQGVSVSTGSAADLQEETGILAGEEVARVQNSAALEAFGYKSRAFISERVASNARRRSAFSAGSTLLSAAHQSGKFG